MSDRHESKTSAPPLTTATDAPLVGDQASIITDNAGCYAHLDDKDDSTQLGISFRLMTPEARRGLFRDIAHRMARVPQETRLRTICHFFRVDPNYGIGVAQALGLALLPVRA